jgi:predicted transcriptional regulator
MATLLEAVAAARDAKAKADAAFVAALTAARRSHSWQEIAGCAGLTVSGVRHHVEQRRKKGGTE